MPGQFSIQLILGTLIVENQTEMLPHLKALSLLCERRSWIGIANAQESPTFISTF